MVAAAVAPVAMGVGEESASKRLGGRSGNVAPPKWGWRRHGALLCSPTHPRNPLTHTETVAAHCTRRQFKDCDAPPTVLGAGILIFSECDVLVDLPCFMFDLFLLGWGGRRAVVVVVVVVEVVVVGVVGV